MRCIDIRVGAFIVSSILFRIFYHLCSSTHGRIVRHRSAIHGERAVSIDIDSATSLGVVVGNGPAVEGKRCTQLVVISFDQDTATHIRVAVEDMVIVYAARIARAHIQLRPCSAFYGWSSRTVADNKLRAARYHDNASLFGTFDGSRTKKRKRGVPRNINGVL